MATASRSAVLVRVQGPDPKGTKRNDQSFSLFDAGITTLSASGTIIPLGDRLVVLTSAQVLRPFLTQKNRCAQPSAAPLRPVNDALVPQAQPVAGARRRQRQGQQRPERPRARDGLDRGGDGLGAGGVGGPGVLPVLGAGGRGQRDRGQRPAPAAQPVGRMDRRRRQRRHAAHGHGEGRAVRVCGAGAQRGRWTAAQVRRDAALLARHREPAARRGGLPPRLALRRALALHLPQQRRDGRHQQLRAQRRGARCLPRADGRAVPALQRGRAGGRRGRLARRGGAAALSAAQRPDRRLRAGGADGGGAALPGAVRDLQRVRPPLQPHHHRRTHHTLLRLAAACLTWRAVPSQLRINGPAERFGAHDRVLSNGGGGNDHEQQPLDRRAHSRRPPRPRDGARRDNPRLRRACPLAPATTCIRDSLCAGCGVVRRASRWRWCASGAAGPPGSS